jgi:transcriptional regulator with XRE-family HTH domain
MKRSKNPQPVLGRVIREFRDEKRMTQEDVAHRARVTVAHLSGIERGHANPTWATVVAIADALGVPLAKLAERWEAAAR